MADQSATSKDIQDLGKSINAQLSGLAKVLKGSKAKDTENKRESDRYNKKFLAAIESMSAHQKKSFKGFKKADSKTGGILAGLFAGAGGALMGMVKGVGGLGKGFVTGMLSLGGGIAAFLLALGGTDKLLGLMGASGENLKKLIQNHQKKF